MTLTGSRATGTPDAFSDWDYVVDDPADLARVGEAVDSALCWTTTRRGALQITTVLDGDGHMRDFNDREPAHESFWAALAARQTQPALAEYWLLAFKHLKAFHRGYDLLLIDVGLDLSVALLRDLYVARHFGPGPYQNPFAYRRIPPGHDFSDLLAVTGMPTFDLADRRAKLDAMNALAATLHPAAGTPLLACFQRRAAKVAPRAA